MNPLFTALGLVMIVGSDSDSSRTIGAIVAGAGLNDVLREHRDKKEA